MTTWITDDNCNRASVEYWGSEEAARASLATLVNCYNCTRCTDCTDCTNCTDCTDCSGCNLTNPHYFLPVSEPRGYTWLAIKEGDEWRIRAGCRNFTPSQALEHFTADDYDGPDTVRDTVPMALEWLDKQIGGDNDT